MCCMAKMAKDAAKDAEGANEETPIVGEDK